MEISDYVSIIALVISATSIYFCWDNNRKNNKLSNAQKKTEILQQIDAQILKLLNVENVYNDILFIYKNEKGFYDYLRKHVCKGTLKSYHETTKELEKQKEQIENCTKVAYGSIESIGNIDINTNFEYLEKLLQGSNRLLTQTEIVLQGSVSVKEKAQNIIEQYLIEKEKMRNDKESE